MSLDRKIKDLIFRAERDAGGGFSVNVLENVPQGEIWFVSTNGKLLSKMAFPTPINIEEFAWAMAEAVEFVGRTKRDPVCAFWINELHVDDFKAVLDCYNEDEIKVEDEPDVAAESD